MDLTGTTIAVTGATGFIGSHIALELARRGAQVRGVVRTPANGAWMAPHGVVFRRGDLTDVESLRRAVDGADAVVANAALTVGAARAAGLGNADYIAANCAGTSNLIDACREGGVRRFVYLSTTAVYRTRLLRTHDESCARLGVDPPRFDWSYLIASAGYAKSKAAAEERVWDSGLDVTVLRPGPVYGERGGRLTQLYAKLLRRRLAFAPTLRLPQVHASDIALAVGGALVSQDAIGRAYNVTGDARSMYAVLREYKARYGVGPRLLPIPVPFGVAYDDSAAKRDLGYSSRPIVEALHAAIAEGC